MFHSTNKRPFLLDGSIFIDERGLVISFNNFNFNNIKRFYQVENFNSSIIRAFHGHKKEAKYVRVLSGAILVCLVEISNFVEPDKNAQIEKFVLSEQKPQILYIPPHYANGFKILQPKTKVIFYSTSDLKSSKKDDFRFPYNYWGEKIWELIKK